MSRKGIPIDVEESTILMRFARNFWNEKPRTNKRKQIVINCTLELQEKFGEKVWTEKRVKDWMHNHKDKILVGTKSSKKSRKTSEDNSTELSEEENESNKSEESDDGNNSMKDEDNDDSDEEKQKKKKEKRERREKERTEESESKERDDDVEEDDHFNLPTKAEKVSVSKMKMMTTQAPSKMKMMGAAGGGEKSERRKFVYTKKKNKKSGEEESQETSSKKIVLFKKLTDLFSEINKIQEKDFDNNESKKLAGLIDDLESHLKKMRSKHFDVVSQIDSSFKLKSNLNQMVMTNSEIEDVEKKVSGFLLTEKQKELLQNWKSSFLNPKSKHLPPIPESCIYANFESLEGEDEVGKGMCIIQQQSVSTLKLRGGDLQNNLLTIFGTREVDEQTIPSISFKWIEENEDENLLTHLEPEEIGFNDMGDHIVSDSKRELIWHSSDQRIKAYPASKVLKGKRETRDSIYTLFCGETSSVNVVGDHVVAGQKGVLKLWKIDKLEEQKEYITFGSVKTPNHKTHYIPKDADWREEVEVTRGVLPDQTMRVREIGEKPIVKICSTLEESINKLYLLPGSSSSIPLYDTDKRRSIRFFVGHTSNITDISVNYKQKLMMTASDDTTCKIWDERSSKASLTLEGHASVITASLFVDTDCSSYVFTGSADRSIKVYDIRSKIPLYELATGCNVPIKFLWHNPTSTLSCLSICDSENEDLDEDNWPVGGRFSKFKDYWRGSPWYIGSNAIVSYIFTDKVEEN